MKVKMLTVNILVCLLLLSGCKSNLRNVDSTAIITPETTAIATPTPEPTEPPIQAADILDEMKLALDEQESYSIDEYFQLELTGGMNDAYTRISSELDYTRTEDGFKVVGAERVDRDAGSNDKVTQYRVYAESNLTEEGEPTGVHLETLASGNWSKKEWTAEAMEALDHVSRFYYIVDNHIRAEYLDVQEFEGKSVHVIDYKLSPVDMRNTFAMLEQYSVPSELIGEEGLNELMAETELIARLYIEEESMLPIKIAIDYTPLMRAMLDKLNIKIEIEKADGEFIIGEYGEIDVQVPNSAKALYGI